MNASNVDPVTTPGSLEEPGARRRINTAKLKSYAPQARRDFIAAVTARAQLLGLSEANGTLEVAPAEKKGDITFIAGQAWPAKVDAQRNRLIDRMRKEGYQQTLEAIAYTWFNRFAALRYMEIHDYLGHGYRVLSSREGGMPELLQHAVDLAESRQLAGLNARRTIELKLAGNKDGELYRELLVAQCNALSSAMPFLFEHIDDETELLLPDNLLRTDSLIAKLVEAIPEEDWQQVEIIGWLYQFYISEKKDQVIGKVVKSEDIPAATQLFTPNWIVQYLVQNSVGRLWLMANPGSTLKEQWPYYIEPAEQTTEVNAQLDALIQDRMDEDGGSLNPETITVLDPACGSGHILVEAYEVLKGIYLERGHRLRDIPRFILEKNLYGLDIDDRAAQLAAFSLLMKARADDRRLLDTPPKLNVISLQESNGLNLDDLIVYLQPHGVNRHTLAKLLDTFVNAKTFGSLIQLPTEVNVELSAISSGVQQMLKSGDLYSEAAAKSLLPLVRQALLLGMDVDAVVANPPYMGSNYFASELKDFVSKHYNAGKADLYGCFILRNLEFCRSSGVVGMITIPNWMFLSSFEELRERIYERSAIANLIHNGRGVFGSDFGSCSFLLASFANRAYRGKFKKLFEKQGSVAENEELEARFHKCNSYIASAEDLAHIPGKPVAYWTSGAVLDAFKRGRPLREIGQPRQGLATGDNARFLRLWHEVDFENIGFGLLNRGEAKKSGKRWFPCTKGGPFRKWYGNNDYVVDWLNDGELIRNNFDAGSGRLKSRPQNMDYYFREGISWSTISISSFSMRYIRPGSIFETKGAMCFAESNPVLMGLLAFSNTKLVDRLLQILSPTVDYHEGPFGKLPILEVENTRASTIARDAVEIAKSDWDAFETSSEFVVLPFLRLDSERLSISWESWRAFSQEQISRMRVLEEQNNRLFIERYGLQAELSPDVPEDQITLVRADREKDCQRLISYIIGCVMGRYSLDEPGLIFAHRGNIGFDATRYRTLPADADAIVPITDEIWFEDDAVRRVREFLLSVWGAKTLNDNIAWLAESLGQKSNDLPEGVIRRYLVDRFFKDHLQTYKRRPIYWLFSSGKQGAFQALVYLHRYHEGTLARMRSEYVVPLTGKIVDRIEMLNKDLTAANSTAARNKLSKEIEKLKKKHVELLAYDDKLRHYADQRIKLNLDDGVKANYGKFGDLLAEVKTVTGGAGDD